VGDSALTAIYGNTGYNTAVGQAALTANTLGGSNTAVGQNALATNQTGSNNTGLGYSALSGATGGNSTAVGWKTLFSSTAGPNSALGCAAGGYITSGSSNTAIGTNAMAGVSSTPLTGNYNTGIGDTALNTIQGAANENTALGYEAAQNVTTGTNITAAGIWALQSTTTGSYSTAFGASALNKTTSGTNSAFGYSAGQYITSGSNDTALGTNAMLGIAATPLTGNANTAVGDTALTGIYGGAEYNTAVGQGAGNAGTALTTGSSNVYIGYDAGASAATDTNEIVIGASATGKGSNTIVLGNSSIAGIFSQMTSITGLSDRRKKKDIEAADLSLDFIIS
jgi:trimeric autotransporter adhesin